MRWWLFFCCLLYSFFIISVADARNPFKKAKPEDGGEQSQSKITLNSQECTESRNISKNKRQVSVSYQLLGQADGKYIYRIETGDTRQRGGGGGRIVMLKPGDEYLDCKVLKDGNMECYDVTESISKNCSERPGRISVPRGRSGVRHVIGR